jgi:hypothetical protein
MKFILSPSHIKKMKKCHFLFFLVFLIVLTACVQTPVASQVNVTVIHDGKTEQIKTAENVTVAQTLAAAGISLNSMDRVDPSPDTIVSENLSIEVIRITETYSVEESSLPFESQTIKNESLAAGQTILIQSGRNGIQSITYRILSEDGVEVSKTISKTDILQASQPEIIMVGMQSSFRAVEITGSIAYISSSNAWLMESNTGNRRALVTTGDLDGRIFTISPDHDWLLFSRSNSKDTTETINSLWVIRLSDAESESILLTLNGKPVKNVVHYADWVPGKAQTIAFSTVEPRSTAPGWQANNDLQVLKFDASGASMDQKTILETTPGGIYGWWGTIYSWSPDASEIAYARPDSIGLVDSKSGSLNPLVEFTPYDTQGDWAWVPWVAWTENHSTLYTVLPAVDVAANVKFDLTAFLTANEQTVDLKPDVGLFSYPAVSHIDKDGNYRVAFLTASIPDQSETSRYALRVMDRDGSNDRKLYPDEGVQGLDPQQVAWSPKGSPAAIIAFVAQGNMMFVDPVTGKIDQITGDGSISRIDWK